MSRLEQSALVFPSASQVSVKDDSNVGYESGSTGNASTLARKRAGTPWTAQDDARLLQMHKEGINLAAIAMSLGRSTRSVQERQQWTLRPGSRSSQTPLDLSESGSLSKPKRFSEAEKMTVVYHRRCLEWKWVDIARLLPGRKPRVIQMMYLRHWRELYQAYPDEDLRQAMSREDEGAGQPSRSLPQDASSSNAKRRFSTLCYNAGRNFSNTNSYSSKLAVYSAGPLAGFANRVGTTADAPRQEEHALWHRPAANCHRRSKANCTTRARSPGILHQAFSTFTVVSASARLWSVEEDRKLLDLDASNVCTHEIALQMGRTYKSIQTAVSSSRLASGHLSRCGPGLLKRTRLSST